MKKKKSKLKKILISAAIVVLIVAAGAAYAFRGLILAWMESFSVSSQSEELQSIYSSESEKEPESEPETEHYEINQKFSSLLEINKNTVGWLKIEGIGVDLPVVQYEDNSYYLKKDFYGEESRHGTLFASCYNVLDKNLPRYPDDNIIIYGHNMLDGIMFSNLTKFKKADFAAENLVVSFDTLWEDGNYVVFASFIANTLEEHGEPFLYNTMRRFSGAAEKQEFIDEVMKRSLIITDVDVTPEDSFLTLSTCTYDFDGARLVVVARRLRQDEKPEDFSGAQVVKNESPLMPDIWNELYK